MCFMGFMDMQHLNDKVKFVQTINFIRKVLSVLETTRFKTIKKNQIHSKTALFIAHMIN